MAKKREFLIAVTCSFIALLLMTTVCHAESLYVFYPTVIRPNILEEKLSEACPGVDIVVFGRYKDFKEKVLKDNPDAVLTKTPLLEQLLHYDIKYRGLRNGSIRENYVLLSVDKPLSPQELTRIPIGAVDFLGRKEMNRFVKELLKVPPRLKRVTKIEDLLPLMTFKMAQGILITEKDISYFKEISKLNFIVTPLPRAMAGIAALAVKKNGNSPAILKAVKEMPAKTTKVFGVEKWK